MNKDWQYDAFISYRHMQPDSFVAQTLHRCLENFRLPRNVARQKGEDHAREKAGESGTGQVKTRIRRVFRDKEELPLVSNLADPITEALSQSEYLIVICSPRLNESIWCRKEIETFIQMHDREHVLAVGDSGRLTVWESLHESNAISFRPEGEDLSWECHVGFVSENKILYPQQREDAQEELCVQDLETDEITTYPCNDYGGVIPIPEKEAFLVVEEEGCYLVGADGKAESRLWWQELEEGLYAKTGFEADQVVAEDGRILVAIELSSGSGDHKRVAVLAYPADLGESPEISLYPVEYEYIKDLCLEEGRYQQGGDLLYVISNRAERTEQKAATAGMLGRLQVIDLFGQKEL